MYTLCISLPSSRSFEGEIVTENINSCRHIEYYLNLILPRWRYFWVSHISCIYVIYTYLTEVCGWITVRTSKDFLFNWVTHTTFEGDWKGIITNCLNRLLLPLLVCLTFSLWVSLMMINFMMVQPQHWHCIDLDLRVWRMSDCSFLCTLIFLFPSLYMFLYLSNIILEP